jgi:beta-N-acetylhexosaminidase
VSGGLFGVGVAGTALTASERRLLEENPPFGVILFRRNIEAAEQVRELVASVKAAGARLVFIDQEGGPVDRLRDLVGRFPSLARAAAAGQARGAGALAGAALAALGIDVDLAPVVDRALPGAGAQVLGERSASSDAGEVVRAAAEFLAGLHDEGIGGCLKHFPGLGRARLDTHLELPVVPEDRHQEALDLAPFDALMGASRAVMVSHAADPNGTPSSLSYERATVMLRDRLGFAGAAFSDDLGDGRARRVRRPPGAQRRGVPRGLRPPLRLQDDRGLSRLRGGRRARSSRPPRGRRRAPRGIRRPCRVAAGDAPPRARPVDGGLRGCPPVERGDRLIGAARTSSVRREVGISSHHLKGG